MLGAQPARALRSVTRLAFCSYVILLALLSMR